MRRLLRGSLPQLERRRGMIVKDIVALMGNEVDIMIENSECAIYEGKVYALHGEYLQAEVEWIRPFRNGIALRVAL